MQLGSARFAYFNSKRDIPDGERDSVSAAKAVYGVGPHFVATVPNGPHPIIFNLRYYQEFDAVNRFQGRSITWTTTIKF